jgi:hypothetical protein
MKKIILSNEMTRIENQKKIEKDSHYFYKN